MSSETQNVQQLYESEKHRAKLLEKKNDRLEVEMGQVKQRLEAEVVQVKHRVDDLEATSELKDERIRAQDSTIQDLQTALDNADRPRDSDEDKSRLLQELLNANAEMKYLQEYNQRLEKDLVEVMAESDNHIGDVNDDFRDQIMGSLMSIMTKDSATRTKLSNCVNSKKRKLAEYKKEPRPYLQGVQPQSSPSPSPRPSEKQIFVRKRLNDGQRAMTPPKTAPKDEPSKQATEKPRETADQGFTTQAKKGSAPATQGPKQLPLGQQLASKNAFAALANKKEQMPKSPGKSTDGRQPSPSLSSVSQNEEKRDQKDDSASRPSNDSKPPKAAQPLKTPAPAQAPARTPSPTSTPARAAFRPQNQGSASKSALQTNKEAWTQPKSSLSPAATTSAPDSSRSMAQVAVDPPPKPMENPSILFMLTARKEVPENPKVKSEPTDMMKIRGGSVGLLVEPGKPIPKVKPVVKSMEELEKDLGSMPKKWGDLVDPADEETDAPLGRTSHGDQVAHKKATGVASPSTVQGNPSLLKVSANTSSVTATDNLDQAAPKEPSSGKASPSMGKGDPRDERKAHKVKTHIRLTSEGWKEFDKEAEIKERKAKEDAAARVQPEDVTKMGDIKPEETAGVSALGTQDSLQASASESIAVGTDKPGTADSHSKVDPANAAEVRPTAEQEHPAEIASGKPEDDTAEKGTIVPQSQDEGTSLTDPAKGETEPSTPAASEPSLPPGVAHKGKKDFQEEEMYKGKRRSIRLNVPGKGNKKSGK